MSLINSFTTEEEDDLFDEFLRQGYIIRDAEEPDAIKSLRREIVRLSCNYLGIGEADNDENFLNSIHKIVPVDRLNDFRMAIYHELNALSWFRPTYYALGKRLLNCLVGNELAMQNRINLSIQMPDDNSSLLQIHTDAHSGETPFQVVQWLPLVDVYETKSMFILPPKANKEVLSLMKEIVEKDGIEGVFERVRDQLIWLSIPFGKVLIFTPNLLHGNIVNETLETRSSLNCRFTGLFTPYVASEKSLGNFYLPITTRAVSRIGMNYRPPEGFDEIEL